MAGVRIPFITEFDSKGIDQLTKKMAGVGKRLTKAVTAPIVGLGVASIKTAMDFEDSFAKIEGLVGVSASELGKLEEAAKKLGPAYGKSATEAAEALFFITSAGLRGAEATDVLEASLKASAIGLGDVNTIADLATSSMNAYGSDILSATAATDALTAAVRLGKLAPEELAGSIGAILPLASAMSVDFGQVNAAFAAMSRTGTDAATGATQLRGILSGLIKVTPKAEKQLEEFGLSGAGLREELREKGLLSVLETLTSTFGDNETAIANVFGNVRALTGVMDLMGSNVDGTREIFDEMTNSAGILDEAFGVTADTASFQLSQAMAEFKAILLEIGQELIPIFQDTIIPLMKDIAEQVKVFIERFQALDEDGKKQVLMWIGIAAAIGPLLIVMSYVIKAVMIVGGVIKLLSTAILFLAKFAIGALIKVLAFLAFSPIGWVVLAIGGLILIGVALVKNWELIKEKAMILWQNISEFFMGIKNSISENLQIAKDDFIKAMDGFKQGAKNMVNTVTGYFNSLLTGIESVINGIGTALNRIPSYTVPEWVPGFGGKSFSAPRMNTVQLPRIPMLADGGIVTRPTLAMIGEAGPEAVIPLNRAGAGTTININVNAGMGSNGNQIGQQIVEAIRRYERSSGPVFASA